MLSRTLVPFNCIDWRCISGQGLETHYILAGLHVPDIKRSVSCDERIHRSVPDHAHWLAALTHNDRINLCSLAKPWSFRMPARMTAGDGFKFGAFNWSR